MTVQAEAELLLHIHVDDAAAATAFLPRLLPELTLGCCTGSEQQYREYCDGFDKSTADAAKGSWIFEHAVNQYSLPRTLFTSGDPDDSTIICQKLIEI